MPEAVPELNFAVEDVRPLQRSATPHQMFRLRVAQTAKKSAPAPIQSVMLQCQIRIEPALRRYSAAEQSGLYDLFGEPQRWGQTLGSMLWTNCAITIPAFTGGTTVDLPVACTYDFNLAATKYFHALRDGEIPLELLFSGTIFYLSGAMLRVAPIAWDRQAGFRLPVRVWHAMMDECYSNFAWLCLRKDVFERLYRYKSRRALATWEQALDSLLANSEERSD